MVLDTAYIQEGGGKCVQREISTPEPLQERRDKVCINKSNRGGKGQVPRRWGGDVPQSREPQKCFSSFRLSHPTSVVFATTMYNLHQLCLIELPTMMEMVHICTVQYDSH